MKIIKKDARELRNRIIKTTQEQTKIQNFNVEEWIDKKIKYSVTIYEDWFTIKNTIKKKDISNREKFLTDSIMMGLGLKDEQIFIHIQIKKHSNIFKAEIEIELID